MREATEKKGEKEMPKETKEKKDLSMTDESWNNRIERVNAFMNHEGNAGFFESSDEIQDGVELINMNIRRGNRNASKRKTYWKQILDEGREWKTDNYPDLLETSWPVMQGKESNLPAHVQASTGQIYELTFDAAVNYWNNHPIIQVVSIRSGRNKEEGGQPYADAEEYAKGKAFAMKQRFVKLFNDGRWDGNFSLDGMTIALPPAKEEENAEGDADDSSDA